MPIEGGGSEGGGSGGAGTGGGSGGSSFDPAQTPASSFGTPTGDAGSGLRALIRKRYMQTSSAGPSYATPAPASPAMPQPVAGPAPATPAAPPPLPSYPGAPAIHDPGKADFGAGALGSISQLLREFLSTGTFDPGVNPDILSMVRSKALEDAQAGQAHHDLLAQSLGVDSATRGSAALQADLAGQGDVSRAVSGATLEELTHQRDFGQQLLEALLGKQGQQNVYDPNKINWGSIISSLIPNVNYNVGGIH
jgi:hypothetical protein